jgi:hypothetical protein
VQKQGKRRALEMRTQEIYTDYHDHFEYFGNTEIERIHKQGKIHLEKS